MSSKFKENQSEYSGAGIIKALPPTKREKFTMRILIACGFVFLIIFLWWFFLEVRIGHPVLYWFLTATLVFKLLRMVHEWYHYMDIGVPEKPRVTRQWKVDVLTTACPGEPYEMIINTLKACQQITYPHTTYLCDEGDDPVLKKACEELGVIHVTRTIKKDAKAGNINNALQQATGEICLILDPDHVPVPEFLDRVLPYFENPKIGFVQVVQAYGNQLKDNPITKGVAEQTYSFYGPMMMCMSNYGTAQAIGANCTFRRAALDSIGGHAPGLAEDMHTAMLLHAKGWKSVYVPEVLSRGFVPATMSAYYKQQLKWSRGTFELLYTTYFKLFRNFTWRQRIHYFTVPLYYLYGVFGLVDILIPITALVALRVPWEVDFFGFCLFFAPLLVFSLLIRQYSQKWFLESHERGIHVMGGILRTGTWWIFLIGIVYTFLRVKVPYIPTPKDDKPENSWVLSIPNMLVCVVSLAAIIYGLSIDRSPYTYIMIGFAFTNVSILGFNVVLGQHKLLLSVYQNLMDNSFFMKNVMPMRGRLWRARHFVFSLARNGAIVYGLLIVVIFGSFIMVKKFSNVELDSFNPPKSKSTGGFFTGVYVPPVDNELSIVPVRDFQVALNHKFDLISLYQAWGPESVGKFPMTLLRDISKQGSVPMITWEPWSSTFPEFSDHPDLSKNRKICKAISDSLFDEYIQAYAGKIMEYREPVFIRFGHEPDNPGYPWSHQGGNTPAEYIAAWKYVVTVFKDLGVSNVAWVWSPWKPEAMDTHFPAGNFVDWIGLTCLNYGTASEDQQWYSFDQLYKPFKDKLSRLHKPVMLAEFGSTPYGGDQTAWIDDALISIRRNHPEIKSLVFFHSNSDANWATAWRPQGNPSYIDWTFQDMDKAKSFSQTHLNHEPFNQRPLIKPLEFNASKDSHRSASVRGTPGQFELLVDGAPYYIKGVSYNPTHDWRDGNYPLTRQQLRKDFSKIRDMGANTIRRYNPGIYDWNILTTANEFDLKVLYGFWFDPEIDYYKDSVQIEKSIQQVERIVRKHKDSPGVLGWALGNGEWGLLRYYYHPPYLCKVRDGYLEMIERIARMIHKIDPERPVFAVMEHASHLPGGMVAFHELAPSVDVIGINSYYREQISRLHQLTQRLDSGRAYMVSEFGPRGYWDPKYSQYGASGELIEDSDYEKKMYYQGQWINYVEAHKGYNMGGFAYGWRDRQEGSATWYGLTDMKGRVKPSYFGLKELWTDKEIGWQMHDAVITSQEAYFEQGKTYEFKATTENNHVKNMTYEWYLYSEEYLYDEGAIERLSGGTRVKVTIPNKPSNYRLYLYVSDGSDKVVTASKSLPVY